MFKFKAARAAARKMRNRQLIRKYLREAEYPRLHIGCGEYLLEDWLNTNLYCPKRHLPVVAMDATKPFPFNDNTFYHVFSEHMIEHVSYEAGQRMLGEVYRVLRPGGRIRISTPNLDWIFNLWSAKARSPDRAYMEWAAKEWKLPGSDPIFVFNNLMRDWGHTFIYDQTTLVQALQQAGFDDVHRCELHQSSEPFLRCLENVGREPPGFVKLESLILEAIAR